MRFYTAVQALFVPELWLRFTIVAMVRDEIGPRIGENRYLQEWSPRTYMKGDILHYWPSLGLDYQLSQLVS